MTETEVINSVLSARYYAKGENSWEDVCYRVSNFIGNNETERKAFFSLMKNKKFLPNSPTLMNAGKADAQLNACFVLPVEDDIDSIMDCVKYTAKVHKSGGGTGFNFSKLRRRNEPLSTGGKASGPVSFMRVWDTTTDVIKQGGTRRGANMGILNSDHPDIMDFIHCKSEEGKISNFNLSVMIMRDIIDSVKARDFKRIVSESIRDDGSKKVTTVGDIWSGIINGMWKNGEPSCLFYDNINDTNMLKNLGELNTTNPCGEQILYSNESCNLGSLNLSAYVNGDEFDWDNFKIDIACAFIFLNNVIDKNTYPLSQIEDASHKTRRVGLGIMGYHDALIKQRVNYDSDEALMFLTNVLTCMLDICISTSIDIAKKDGTFDAWEGSEWQKLGYPPMRNGALLSIAPTGSISLLAGCSSSLEPNFNYVYMRRNTIGKEFLMVNPLFESDLKRMCRDNTKLYDKIINQVFTEGTLQNVSELPKKVKELYKSAIDITPEWHLKTLAHAQKFVDASISKTINLPEFTSVKEVEKIVLDAHDMGCKGVTVYRTNSRREVVLSAAKNEGGFVEVIQNGKVYVKCPECGHLTEGHGGCNTCESCGFTKCS